MAIPKYHELIRPLLDLVVDGRTRNLREASQELAQILKLTEEDLAETIPSGYPKFLNRVGWAKSDLAKTELVESCGRGTFRISAKGRADLPSLPAQLDRKFFESRGYATWKSTAPVELTGHDAVGSSDATLTPEEQIDETLAEL